MDSNTPSLADQLASAQDWWRDAGVDCDYSDEPENWLSLPEAANEGPRRAPSKAAPEAEPAAEPEPTIGGDAKGWPQDLASFTKFWLDEESLDTGGTTPRIPPRGPAGARMLILVPEPELSDTETLLSGPQGQFLAAMLRAMAIEADQCYFASALPRHTPLADWGTLAHAGMGKVLRHHLRLAAPKGVIAFGQSILPLLGHDPAQAPLPLRQFNHESGEIPILPARNLAVLMDRAGERARFWRRWLEWTDTND